MQSQGGVGCAVVVSVLLAEAPVKPDLETATVTVADEEYPRPLCVTVPEL